MLQLRVLLHARERILLAPRTDRLWIHRSGFTWNMAAALFFVRGQESRRHTQRYDSCRSWVRRLVHSLLESALAGIGSKTESAVLRRF